jgi:polyisoprenoid-binding protein YceI
MGKRFAKLVLAVVVLVLTAAPLPAADNYTVDSMHSSVGFKASHMGLSWIHGRFNEFSGSFTIDEADPAKCAFALTIKVASIDTNNKKRDGHLNSPDFFNSKQYPEITFKSTAVKAIKDGYEVTGDLTMHGETKPVTFKFLGGRKGEFPKGVQRTGYSTELTIKRSDFGMVDKMPGFLGDEVPIAISLQAMRK